MGAEARWQSRLADWQQSREQTAESRSDRMVNRGEPLRRSQIAVQAGKQAASQHEPAPAPEPEPEARPADEPCSCCCALV